MEPVRSFQKASAADVRAAASALRGERRLPGDAGEAAKQRAAKASELVRGLAEAGTPTGASSPALMRAVVELRKALSTTSCPPIQDLIDAGVLVPLMARLRDASPAVQLEVAWSLTNLTAGNAAQTAAAAEAGAGEALFGVLASAAVSERPDLCDQCLSALGNIAGDGNALLRDRLLDAGVMEALGQLYSQMPHFPWDLHARKQVLRTLTWLMGCLCRGSPAPPFEKVDCAFDYFAHVLVGTDDAQMLSEALWGLTYLLEAATEAGSDAHASGHVTAELTTQQQEASLSRAQRLLQVGYGPGEVPQPPREHPLVRVVVQCCSTSGRSDEQTSLLPAPALRLLGALAGAPASDVTDILLAAGALQALRGVLADPRAPSQLHLHAAWAAANMAAGSPPQALRFLEDTDTWEVLCKNLEQAKEPKVRQECAWAIANVAKRAPSLSSRLDSRKTLRQITFALKEESVAAPALLQHALLDAAEALFRQGDEQQAARGLAGANPVVGAAAELGLAEVLEELQASEREDLYLRARQLLECWFGAAQAQSCEKENAPPSIEKGEISTTPNKTTKTPTKPSPVAARSPIPGVSPIRPFAHKSGGA